MPVLSFLDTILKSLSKGLEVYDHYIQTKWKVRYQKIIVAIAHEEAKPIYPIGTESIYQLRDQAKIDELYLQLKILLEQFLKEEKKNG